MLAGKKARFETAVRAYSADLYRFAWWMCQDRFVAEELVQETFTRAWKSWDSLQDPARLRAWLYSILRNECSRAFVTARTRQTAALDLEQDLPTVASIEADLEIRQIIELLPPEYRVPLLLQSIGGFSCRDIASMLAISEGAVMTRLTRARRALRDHWRVQGQRREVG